MASEIISAVIEGIRNYIINKIHIIEKLKIIEMLLYRLIK